MILVHLKKQNKRNPKLFQAKEAKASLNKKKRIVSEERAKTSEGMSKRILDEINSNNQLWTKINSVDLKVSPTLEMGLWLRKGTL